MSVTVCDDGSPAAWIGEGRAAWDQVVRLGPAGFERYARLRFIPDPSRAGQHESDAPAADGSAPEIEQLRTAARVLRSHTRSPDHCFFALWDGWGLRPVGGTGRTVWHLPHRAYFLFSGPLVALEHEAQWRPALSSAGQSWWMPLPAFVWPRDRSWCLTRDVDPHYAGIAASSAAVEDLLALSQLDVVVADPAVEPPHYA